MKFHSILAKSTALFLVTSTMAAANMTGFFLKGNVGYNSLVADYEGQSSATFSSYYSNNTSMVDSNDLNVETGAITGSINLGYLYPVHKHVTVGAQLGVAFLEDSLTVHTGPDSGYENDFSDIYASNSDLEDEVSRNSIEPTLDIILGLTPVKGAMLFGLVGTVYNEIELESEHTFTFNNPQRPNHSAPIFYQTTATDEETESVLGLRLGLGGIYELNNKWAVNLDYIYTYYGTANTSTAADVKTGARSSNPNLVIQDGLTSSSSATVTDQRISLGMSYFFGAKQPKPVYHGPDK